MRAAARVSRFRLLFVLLLVLVGVSAPAMADAGHGKPEQPATSVSVAPALPDYQVLHDRPRGSVTTGHVSIKAWSDTWWVGCLAERDGVAPLGRLPIGETRGVATVALAHAPRSSRAPPAETA